MQIIILYRGFYLNYTVKEFNMDSGFNSKVLFRQLATGIKLHGGSNMDSKGKD